MEAMSLSKRKAFKKANLGSPNGSKTLRRFDNKPNTTSHSQGKSFSIAPVAADHCETKPFFSPGGTGK